VLRPNERRSFVCEDVRVRVVRGDTAFTARCGLGHELVLPVKHGEGCFYLPEDMIPEVEEQIVLRYAPGENPNGATDDVAGIVSDDGNVMGLMPHPEHAVDPLLASGDGALLLASLVDAAAARAGFALR
jgi:phosphoribosylformylglycinamidine synthase